MKALYVSILFFFPIIFYAQISQKYSWVVNEFSDLPEPVSNNAVVEGWVNDTGYVYSFGGIDSTKIWSGIHLRSFRYNTISDVWDTIPSLPDTLGKIAASASLVDSIIYIIGGYHVYANHNESSSAKVHRFDPRTNTYLSDGADIPIPIDDHVNCVYKDSLIFIVTGWSNNNNIPNTQIFDPANNIWYSGSNVHNNNIYKSFGASGCIVGDTLYYIGGAAYGVNFPIQNYLRKGYINPSNHTQIIWSHISIPFPRYRSASLNVNGYPSWLGGAETTYNYNGIAYNGSGGVDPTLSQIHYDQNTGSTYTVFTDNIFSDNVNMDHRGVANFLNFNNRVYLVGGMERNQKVSNKTIMLNYFPVGIEENIKLSFKTYPNPTSSQVNLLFDEINDKTIYLTDVIGNQILTFENNSNNIQLDLTSYPKGIYFVRVDTDNSSTTQKIILQ